MRNKEHEYKGTRAPESENINHREKKPSSSYLETVFQSALHRVENQILQLEVEQLRAENKGLAEYIERRRRQARESGARIREDDREGYNAKKREYMREWRARKKQAPESQESSDDVS